MSTKPILYNTEMVRAILDGRKTVTRRLIKPQPEFREGETGTPMICDDGETWTFKIHPYLYTYDYDRKAPCSKGDILYVRETFTKLFYVDPDGYTHFDQPMYYYAADGDPGITLVDAYGFEEDDQRIRWKPSIHMPKEAARIFLRVKDVRVERLQDITEEQAIAEGVPDEWPMDPVYCPKCQGEGLIGALHPGTLGYMEVDCPFCMEARTRFANLWKSTIKPADQATYGWAANPWVWVIEFERISKEEAEK